MIIGHVGVAYAARRHWAHVPLPWLLVATFAPDIAREILADTGRSWWESNTYSHALPWSGVLALGLASIAGFALRNGVSATVIGAMVTSHVLLDMISGWKPLWIGGPAGLNLEHIEPAELAVEAAIAWAGWRVARRTTLPHVVTSRRVLVLLFMVQASYLVWTYRERPARTRCLLYPIAPCWTSL